MESLTVDYVLDVWFSSNATSNVNHKYIREKLGHIFECGIIHTVGDWGHLPRGRLALILLYDQAARFLFDDTPRMYAYDANALELSNAFWEDKSYESFDLRQQMFVFLPYHHSESIDYQRRALSIFQRLAEQDRELESIAKTSGAYNLIIERFGRFPHRNTILGRKMREEEWEFLAHQWCDQIELRELKDKGHLPEKYHGLIKQG